ncbi:hypothetical protein [uncultured Chitinophaga sp.]|uniref:hypothetical protein n=1 Tax=uncultured Chitinophaga sp. TaxID=339340 RepID=UPI0025E47051|nr:hypothetical protein [uncultured Chitinophaga sp.]
MKKWPLILLSFCMHTALQAQDVVSAELAFAKYAADSSVKQAFLRYADSNGVVFDGGMARNTIRFWSAANEGGFTLVWLPTFAATSGSGDLGFTTGPYEVRRTLNDTAVAAGHYTTVWKKNGKGEWKFLADLGIYYKPSLYQQQPVQTFNGLTPSTDSDSAIYALEKNIILAHDTIADEAFRRTMADSVWFNIEGIGPFQGKDSIMKALERVPISLKFNPMAGGISQNRDLAYVYGTVKHNQRNEAYMRIWGHTREGWKLLLQVLKW